MADNQDDKWFIAHIEDLAEEALRSDYVTFSDFLDDHRQSLLAHKTGRLSVCSELWGGYENAERVICAFYPPFMKDLVRDMIGGAMTLLRITPADQRFLKRELTHRDYLGSIMGTGIKREKIGDILLDDEGAWLFVTSDMADYLKEEMTSVGRSVVSIREAQMEELPPPPKGEEQVISLSSLRLDAVVAHGFHMGRGEAAKWITQGLVARNGQMINDADKKTAIGDKISVRGKGRLIIKEERGVSRSGRLQILVEKFSGKVR